MFLPEGVSTMSRFLRLLFFLSLFSIACAGEKHHSPILWGIEIEGTMSFYELYIYSDSTYLAEYDMFFNGKVERGVVTHLGADTMYLVSPKTGASTTCTRMYSTYVIHGESSTSDVLSNKSYYNKELSVGDWSLVNSLTILK